jgi:outer membrane protein assembly factor BamA
MRRRLVFVFLALSLLGAVGALIIHAPPARSLALRYAVRMALDQGIQIEAQRLDYNLATRHVRLVNVRLSAVGDSQPFLTAAEVAATASVRVFLGEVAFEDVNVVNGAVHVVRRADGTTNLPLSPGAGGGGDPAPLPVARVSAPKLSIDYRDEPADVTVRVPALTVDLSSRGRLALDVPAEVRVGSTSTRIETFEGAAAFDGRDLRLANLRLATPELGAGIDGLLALIRREPSVDVRVTVDAALENAAMWWGQTTDAPRGRLRVEGIVSGPLSDVEANLQLSSDRVSWQRLGFAGVAARLRIDVDGVEIEESRAAIAGGLVSANGSLVFESGRARAKASWRDVDAAELVGAIGVATVTPAGRAAGELTASGSIDSLDDWTVDLRVALEGGRRGPRRIPLPGETQFRLAAKAWGLEARHRLGDAASVEASLMGRLDPDDVRKSSLGGTLRVSESDLPTVLQMLSDTGLASVQHDVVTGSIRATADVSGTAGEPILQLAVESDRAVVAGQEFAAIQARGRLGGSTFDLEELSAAQPALPGGGTASGRVRAIGQYDLKGGEYTATVNATSWRVVPTSDLPLSGLVNLEYSGRGRGRMVFGKARLVSNLSVSPDIVLGDIAAEADLLGDQASITIRAPVFNATAQATVSLEAPYPATVRANATALDLARALTGFDVPVSVDGTADVGIAASGSLEQWRNGRASLEVSRLDGHMQTLPVSLREPARVQYDDGQVRVDRLEATIGKTSVSVAGSIPVSSRSTSAPTAGADAVLATLTGDLYDVAVAASATASATRANSAEPPIAAGRGPFVLVARVTGSLESPTYAADAEIGPGMVQARSDLAPVENLLLRAHLENGLLELQHLAGSYHGAAVTATGQAPLSLLTGGTTDTVDRGALLRATAVGVTAAVLSPFVDDATISQVGGSLDARLDLTSRSLNLDDVEGEVVLERLNLEVEGLPVTQRVPTRVVAREGIARIESWAWQSEGTSFEVGGQVRLADQQAAILANGTLDARLLTPFLGIGGISTAGRVETHLSVSGALTAPTVDGDIRVADGELRLREPRIVASDLSATAVLAGSSAVITALSGTVNGGILSGSGRVQYSPDIQGAFTAKATGMAMNFPEGLRTEVDSSLELTVAAKEGALASQLSGLVTIRRGAYREPLALVAGVLNNLKRTGTATGTPPSPFLQSLALDVRVITDDDLVIDNNVAKAQLGADLRVLNVAAAPALSGRAELREGGQLFLGQNTYVVENGTIDFANPTTIEPRLGIEASTRAGGVDVQVRINGTPDDLMTELTGNDPETGDSIGQQDLASLLLTGRRLDQLDEQRAAEIGAQALGNLSGDVLGFAGRAVGLDTLRVGAPTNPRDAGDLASETDPTQRVTFGKSLGSTLDVTLSQSLRESNDQTWIIDYLPVRRLAFRFVSDDDDLRSYALRHDVRFGAPAAVRADDVSRQVEPPRVSAVRLAGDLRFPEPQVRGQLRLQEGDRFDFIEWQEDRDRLERFYQRQQHLAARIVPTREESEGVVLTYTIEAGPETHIRVAGMTLPDRALQEIEIAWTQAVFEGFLVEEAEAIVRRELALQATHQPSIEIKVEGDDSVRTLLIDVTPGPRARRIDVRFDGVDEPLKSDLLEELAGSPGALQAVTDPRAYERTVLAALRARGYAQAAATVGEPMFDETMATVPVTVNAGPQLRVGRVGFEGTTTIPLDELRAESRVQEGALYRAEEVDAARARMQARYRREGFTRASFTTRETVRAPEGTVDVVFSADEGPRQVIREITISGLRQVDETVVRRRLGLETGDALRTADWLEARRRLFESGLFRRVDISVEPADGPPDTSPVDLRVAVEEWPALRLRYGFQVEEQRPEENVDGRDLVPGISADLTRRTLFGRAVTLGAALQYQRFERNGRVFLNTPTFFGRQMRSAFTFERSREDSRANTLVTDITNAAWEQRGRLGRLSLSYGLRFERNRTFDTKPSNPDFPDFPFDLTVHIGRLTSGITWDSRDDPSDSTRGTFVSTSLEHGSAGLGSDLLFIRSLTQAYHFRSWKSLVFASAARYGAVKPLDDQLLVSSLRFFAGGARTLRGVPEDSLGGLDFLGSPLGGRGLLTLNEEVRFPLYRWLRGVAFVDMGNVFPEVSGVRLRELVGSTGLGLRLVTPFALFRVDYGKTIWNKPADDSGRWVFGIGQTF